MIPMITRRSVRKWRRISNPNCNHNSNHNINHNSSYNSNRNYNHKGVDDVGTQGVTEGEMENEDIENEDAEYAQLEAEIAALK